MIQVMCRPIHQGFHALLAQIEGVAQPGPIGDSLVQAFVGQWPQRACYTYARAARGREPAATPGSSASEGYVGVAVPPGGYLLHATRPRLRPCSTSDCLARLTLCTELWSPVTFDTQSATLNHSRLATSL